MYLDDSTVRHATIPVILGAIIATWLAYCFCVALYNITFHPLAKFPGPKLRGALKFPDAYSIFTGHRDTQIRQLHDKYGSIVRLQPDVISFTSAQAWKDIYGFRQGKKQMQKDTRSYVRDENDKLPPSIIMADDLQHSNSRRLLANAFSDNALRGQEEILNHYFELLVTRLNEQVDGPNQGKVNMVGWYNFTTFDIVGDLAFGESFHALERSDYHPWVRAIFRAIKLGGWLRLGGVYPLLAHTLTTVMSLFPRMRQARIDHINFVRNKTKARLDIETDRKDFITYILRAKEDRAMSHDEIIANSGLLIIAGSETTATLLSGVTFWLLRSPAKLAKLVAEVRGAFSSTEQISLVSLGKLPYLHAVLEEGLRMYPPVPTILPRRTPPEGDFIDGRYVSGDTAVGVHQMSAGRSKDNWADPDEFVPERWLSGDDLPKRYRTDKRDAMQPFSTGPRNCLGKNLAYNEMRAILARVVWHFDMELLPESQDWAKQKTYILWQKPELMVRLSRRGKAE